MPHAYLGLATLKTTLDVSGTSLDARLKSVLEGVARSLDSYCGRRFQPYTATHYYRAHSPDCLLLPHDLLSVTSLKTDPDGDRTYPETWATTDYDLMPDNAAAERRPYWRIMPTPEGDYGFPAGVARGVQIAGVWGYWRDLLTLTATVQGGGVTGTATSITLSASSEVEAGHTLLIESEQVYVTAVNSSTHVLTVERGVNGTTAAAHAAAVAVALYRYPTDLVEATLILASRIYRRKDSPLGTVGGGDLGTTMIMRHDTDIERLTQEYRLARTA